jgi:hypothetical protein
MGHCRGNKDREELRTNGVTNIYQRKVAVLGPLSCAWAAKMEKQHRCSIDAAEVMENGTGVEPPRTIAEDKQFKLTGEPLYGGKGKHSGLTTNQYDDSEPCVFDHAEDHTWLETLKDTLMAEQEPYAGLKQPCLLATDTVVLGEGKMIIR